MSFSLKVSCDSYGFRNGFRWVPHAGQKVEFELSPKPCAKTGMGSVWVPISVTYENPPLDSLSAVQKQAWVPCGFRFLSRTKIPLSPKRRAKTSMGSVWVPNGFRMASEWVPHGARQGVCCENRAGAWLPAIHMGSAVGSHGLHMPGNL